MFELNKVNKNINCQNVVPSPQISQKVIVEDANENCWSNRLIGYLNQVDKQVDGIPKNALQEKADTLVKEMKKEFSSLNEFNDWLELEDSNDWIERVADFLVKLPFRSARNVISILYSIVSTALYSTVHPLKGVTHIAKSSVRLVEELTKSSNWPKIGCGSIGAICGQSLILGNPLSLIGIGIGGALALGGISFEAYKAAVKVETSKRLSAIQETLTPQLIKLPESMLTGFFMGLVFGGIQRAMQAKKPLDISKNKIPTYDRIDGVAQYGDGDWSKVISTSRKISLDEAKAIANSDPNITYFFYAKGEMVLGRLGGGNVVRHFRSGDAVFFSGEPWWGSAQGVADGYIKVFV